ncbi:hypothetical protein AAVH_20947 [Aphelenchoides avenae]|nr:hypothetical protein AAVH_20947 [Aphelenchus avenae]
MTYVTVTNSRDVYEGSISEMLAANDGVSKVAVCAGCGVQTKHSIDHMKIKVPPPKILVVYVLPTHKAHAMVKPPAFYRERFGRTKYALKHVITSSLDQEAKHVLEGRAPPAPYTHAIALHNVGGQHGWVAMDDGKLRALHFDAKSIPTTAASALYYVKM